MVKILLVSGNFIKNVTNIDDNMSGKLIEPAIYEAQNEGLRGILGDALVDKLESLVDNNTIQDVDNEKYKRLLDKVQYFLAYTVIADICMLTTVKISPAGREQVGDEHMDPLDITDSYRLRDFYQHKADYLCRQIQNYVLKHRSDYPELSNNDCNMIKANLFSAATTGLWLGGVRGRGYRGYRGYRRCRGCGR